jgi:hypothetical protein
MTPLLVVIALGVLAILAAVVRLSIDLHSLRAELLPDILAALQRQPWSHGQLWGDPDRFSHLGHHFPKWELECFAAWVWRDGGWRLISDKLPAGVDPGPPPAHPGAFSGEVVKTWFPGRHQ